MKEKSEKSEKTVEEYFRGTASVIAGPPRLGCEAATVHRGADMMGEQTSGQRTNWRGLNAMA
jgi:hypothetical protein